MPSVANSPSWKWTDPLTLEVKLRKNVRFPAKPGVMEERELTAEDVVFSYSRQSASAKKIPTYFDHLSKVEAVDKHTVVFRFKEFNAEWDYRFGWGYYSGIMPRRSPPPAPRTGRTSPAPARSR